MKISIIYFTYKMNIKTNLLEEYVNFVDNTKKQNKHFKIFFKIFINLVLFFVFCFIQLSHKIIFVQF